MYVIEDNYPELAQEAIRLRSTCIPIGIKLTILIHSTRKRQAFTTIGTLALLAILFASFHFLS